MVKIERLINTGILNSEWVGFSGDSEYEDADGELHLGYWNFIGIVKEPVAEVPFELDDEISVIDGEFRVFIRNKKGNVCMVEFRY